MKRVQIAAGGVVLVALALAALTWRDASAPTLQRPSGPAAFPGPVAPAHCGGQAVDLAQAFVDVPYSAVLPNTELASPETVTGAWRCPGVATLFEFASGVTLVLDKNTIVNPEESWRRLADSDPSVYSVGVVNGTPASFIDASKDETKTAEGGVTYVVDGVYVSVGGNGSIPLVDLVSIAEELVVESKVAGT